MGILNSAGKLNEFREPVFTGFTFISVGQPVMDLGSNFKIAGSRNT